MIKKILKNHRTRKYEEDGKRCEAIHPNWAFIRCQLSVDEQDHYFHWGEDGYYRWTNE